MVNEVERRVKKVGKMGGGRGKSGVNEGKSGELNLKVG